MDTQHNIDIIKQTLTGYAKYIPHNDPTQGHLLFDDINQSYMLLEIGWREKNYIHQPVIHIEMINEKLWIQQDYTEDGVADDLLQAGIPAEQIVLGFRHPTLRQYTEFAVT